MIIDFTLPTCVLVRKIAKLHRSGELVHGKPVKKENGCFHVWTRSGGANHYDWMPIVCTPEEYFKRDRERSYTVGKWSFTTIQRNKKAPVKRKTATVCKRHNRLHRRNCGSGQIRLQRRQGFSEGAG